MRTVVRDVAAQEVPRTLHVTGGCDGDVVNLGLGGVAV
jgi:hypothetical protein